MDELNISGALLREMFYTGAALLEKEKSAIDALNVFPYQTATREQTCA